MIGTRFGIDVGIAVTTGSVTAVTRRRNGEAEPVLVDGWPTQNLDTRDEPLLTDALNRLHDTIRSDVNSVVVVYPGRFGASRTHRLRQSVMDAGWPHVRTIAAPVAVGLTHASVYETTPVAVTDVTGLRSETTMLEPQPDAEWGHVASHVAGTETQPISDVMESAATAADIPTTEILGGYVIGAPSETTRAIQQLSTTRPGSTVAISPVALASDGLTADDMITSGTTSTRTRSRGTWPRPVSSLACAVAAIAAVGAVMSGSQSVGAQPDLSIFALGCLGAVTAILGAASFAASQIVSVRANPAEWAHAGKVLLVGAGIGATAVIAAILVVVVAFEASPWPLVLTGGAAAIPSIAAFAVVGLGIATHPASPPDRNLWPPVGAMAAVSVAATFVGNTSLDAAGASGWELLPQRIAVGVWMFAIAGLIIEAPWPRVGVGLATGTVATFLAGPVTVPVFAVIVIVVVSGWWIVKAVLISIDRHVPQQQSPQLPTPARPKAVH